MAALFGASIAGRIATGPNAGQHVRVAGNAIEDRYLESLTGPRCANVAGFSLHANVAVRASDRHGLERLCGYTGRGPLATERLTRRPDGRLAYRLKRPWSNLATHVIFNRPELLEKLAGCDEAARGCRAAQAKEPGFGAEPRQSDGPASPISHGPLSSLELYMTAITGFWRRRRSGGPRSCPVHRKAMPLMSSARTPEPTVPPVRNPRPAARTPHGPASWAGCSRSTCWNAPAVESPTP